MRRRVAALAVAALPFTMIAASCDDSDGDGNIDNPDLDPGDGTGAPDLDPGEGTGIPGDDVDGG